MTITDFQIEGYRSLKYLWLRPRRVNVVVGANGCGKSNLYKALKLLSSAAEGRLARSIAEEGGMPSVLWAGSRKGPAQLRLMAKLEGGLKYELACGLPIPEDTSPDPDEPKQKNPFMFDPVVKEETVSFQDRDSKTILLSRKSLSITARDSKGKRSIYPSAATESESVLSDLKEPQLFPELSMLRQEFLRWRFYHRFRTDEESQLRQIQIATRTECLPHDGSYLASALKTIEWVGDFYGLRDAVNNAFPGARLELKPREGNLELGLHMPEFSRAFNVRELSDGTLHYLCMLAALMSPRAPSMMALNEPEVSMHPSLLRPLADLVSAASKTSQIWVITHSFELAKLISERCHVDPIELERVNGETKVKGQKLSPD